MENTFWKRAVTLQVTVTEARKRRRISLSRSRRVLVLFVRLEPATSRSRVPRTGLNHWRDQLSWIGRSDHCFRLPRSSIKARSNYIEACLCKQSNTFSFSDVSSLVAECCKSMNWQSKVFSFFWPIFCVLSLLSTSFFWNIFSRFRKATSRKAPSMFCLSAGLSLYLENLDKSVSGKRQGGSRKSRESYGEILWFVLLWKFRVFPSTICAVISPPHGDLQLQLQFVRSSFVRFCYLAAENSPCKLRKLFHIREVATV